MNLFNSTTLLLLSCSLLQCSKPKLAQFPTNGQYRIPISTTIQTLKAINLSEDMNEVSTK